MIEIAKNKFLAAMSIRGCNVYQKEASGPWRVSFKIDTVVKEEQTQYSDAYKTEEEARAFVKNLTLV